MLEHVPATREARELPAIEAGEADPDASEGVRRVPPGPLAPAGGAGEALGGRAHRRSAGRDPLHGRRSPRGSHRTDGIPRGSPAPGSRGRGARLGHAGRHAPALRSGRARMGRCRAPAGWIGTAHDPPLEDRPGRRGSRPVPREGDRRRSPGDPPQEPGRPSVRPPLWTLRGPPPRRYGKGSRARRRLLRTFRPRRDGPRSRGLRGLRRRRPELRAGGLPPGCLPTTFGASWPAAEPSPGSTGGVRVRAASPVREPNRAALGAQTRSRTLPPPRRTWDPRGPRVWQTSAGGRRPRTTGPPGWRVPTLSPATS